MAKYRTFAGSSRPILVEVDEGGGGKGGSLAETIGVIGDIAIACADAMARVTDKRKPSEVEVSFGLRALVDGSVAVALDADRANFAVTLTWSGDATAATIVEGLTTPPTAAAPRPPS